MDALVGFSKIGESIISTDRDVCVHFMLGRNYAILDWKFCLLKQPKWCKWKEQHLKEIFV